MSEMIKDKSLIHELFDLLREIKDDEQFAVNVAINLVDEDGFREMIDWLKEWRGDVSVGDALYEAALIWQSKQPDDAFEPEENDIAS